jgi:hypothetical protein
VQARRAHRNDDITGVHSIGPKELIGFDNSGSSTRNVVLVRVQDPWVLGRLTTEKCTARLLTAVSDPRDNRSDPLWDNSTGGNVVSHEQRLGSGDDEVIYDHRHEVDPDCVVYIHSLGHRNLRPDTVGRRDQEGSAELRER